MAFDPWFLGFEVSLPKLTETIKADAHSEGEVFDYRHHSFLFNEKRRLAFYTAHNIDGTRIVKGIRRTESRWKLDSKIPEELQIGHDAYDNNVWDKGHLVRREAILWGTSRQEALEAQHDSFLYTNAAPQHGNFNQDEWLELEDFVLGYAKEDNYKLAVFTGPVFTEYDLPIGNQVWDIDVKVPLAFWKIAVFEHIDKGKLALGFIMPQQRFWADKNGASIDLKSYQVSLRIIEDLTHIDFGDIKSWDPLNEHEDADTLTISSSASRNRAYAHDRVPEVREVVEGDIRIDRWDSSTTLEKRKSS